MAARKQRRREPRLSQVKTLERTAKNDSSGVDRRSTLRVGIELRRFAAVEHAVVAHHANPAQPRAGGSATAALEGFRRRPGRATTSAGSTSPGVSTASNTSQPTSPGASGSRPSHSRRHRRPCCLTHSAGRCASIRVTVVAPPTSVSSSRCSRSAVALRAGACPASPGRRAGDSRARSRSGPSPARRDAAPAVRQRTSAFSSRQPESDRIHPSRVRLR